MATSVSCPVCDVHAESTFKIEGMDCREEVAMLERRFRGLPGLEDFSADLLGRRLHVKYDAARLDDAAIAAAVADAGMRAWLEHEEPVVGSAPGRWRRVLLVTAGLTLAAGLAAHAAAGPPVLERVLLAVAVIAGAGLTARRAWHAVRLRSLDIHVLMIIAAAGAVALDQWGEAATVVFLFALAQAMEARTLERARHAIRGLMDLTPAEALVRDRAGERRVSVEAVTPGAVVIIRPGEKIPLDGEVVAGESAVNQAPVTGESLPADKGPGDEVFAGTINGHGALEVRVTRARRDTTLARIIHLVERAQASRAPSQAFVERFARVYTPAVIGLALALALVPPLAFGSAWTDWIYRSLVLLVVSCPCALVISTPVSIVSALAGAARKGVLIKGGAHLEHAGHVRCIAFDKTGTLTYGRPDVVEVIPLVTGLEPDAVIALAASVERRSTHPVGEAILRRAGERGLSVPAGDQVRALAGRGAEGWVGGSRIVLGNHRLFEERRLCTPALHGRLEEIGDGRTTVLVARDGETIGLIALADRPREGGRDALDLLRRQGVEAIVLLTGDGAGTARALAAAVGVDEVRAELLPEDKVAAVEELRRRYGVVAMVGDGINDAPALASADVGIAMGVAGSDVALETADVALMADDLLKIPYAIRLSRAAVRNIQANLGLSLALKAGFVVAAVAGVATLWMAVVADTGASILVVANALRLLRAD